MAEYIKVCNETANDFQVPTLQHRCFPNGEENFIERVSESLADVKISGNEKPVCLIVLGMAGSGKTTFVQRITSHLHAKQTPPYIINLDPACHSVPYPANIDIRETVKYKNVMKQYKLGPNGAIMTSLNLFTWCKFEEVMSYIEKNSSKSEYVIFDTPGQIEVFTTSASGMIVTETLSHEYPTVVVYVMDIVRSTKPLTFMSNMLYACHILYQTKLPFILVLNKTDVLDHTFAVEWMRDFEVFQEAISDNESFTSGFINSMCLVLDEFYKDIPVVGVSSFSGSGVDEFFKLVLYAAKEYETVYKPEYEKMRQKKNLEKNKERLERDLGKGSEMNKMEYFNNLNYILEEPVYVQPGIHDDDTSDENCSTENN